MGRKKKELGEKEKTIHFRISEALYEVVAHEAKQCSLSLSEYCRRVLLNRPVKKLPVIIHDERDILQELRNINRLNNNLNQLARYDVILKDYPELVAKRGGSLVNKPLMIEQDEGDERLRKLYWRTITANVLATVWTFVILVFLGLFG